MQTFPYYLSYYNPLFGGPQAAQRSMMIGWGEGLNEAAFYLNDKAGSNNLHVFSWYDNGPFSYFFNGKAGNIPTQATMEADQIARVLEADYAVIYIHQWQRLIPQPLLGQLSLLSPEKSIYINGLEYIRIYDLANLIPP